MNASLKQFFAFFAIVIVLFLIGQVTLPERLPFFTETVEIIELNTNIILPTIVSPSSSKSDLDSLILKAQLALHYYENKTGLFIDALSADDFKMGHIKGALNIPYHLFMDYLDTLDTFPMDTLIITYCDGAECNASFDLAENLNLMGFTYVKPFFGGWQAWRNAGYPFEVSK